MTTRKVTIVNYGIGNLLSAARAFTHCGAEVRLTDDPDSIITADRLILPGVGAFADCMRALKGRQLAEPVLAVAASGRPIIGICVGMQMLFDVSEEFGEHAGLGVLPGRIKRIPNTTVDGAVQRIPHIGWTAVNPPDGKSTSWNGSVLEAILPGTEFYFLHSFTAWPENESHRLCDAYYGGRRISAAVRKGNVYGIQFHPEKSGRNGLKVLTRFLNA